ncbi:MAG: transglutaminase family protein [Acidobacteriia bacterium]|nr:transglutaminase family protein [Terriglobia bacterium]
MNLRANHTTTYLYSDSVSVCHTEVHLTPRSARNQHLVEHELSIIPAPGQTFPRKDYFGNNVTFFSIHEPHRSLTITASSLVEIEATLPLEPSLTPAWEQARGEIWRDMEPHAMEEYQFVFESPRIPVRPQFAAYASVSFTPERPLLEAAMDLCHRVFEDFQYDTRATTVSTPVEQVFQSRRGVCQDFAHFTIACLRSLGLAARYVSGYLRSRSLIGGEASHAWVSVFCPGFGWLDFDPTNDVLVNGNHVTLSWGRDYADVPPVQGIALGGGEHVINVSVNVKPA